MTRIIGAAGAAYDGWGRDRIQDEYADLLLQMLLFIHGWTCYFAAERWCPKVPMHWPPQAPRDPLMASPHHVLALSRRGLHAWDNIRPAHLSCNQEDERRLRRYSALSEGQPPLLAPELLWTARGWVIGDTP